jgi:hypothetical protein
MRQPIRSTQPSRLGRRQALALAAFGLSARVPMAAASAPVGQLTWGVHVSLAPTWFDPAEMSGAITSFMLLYALHDAMLKPMPDQPMAPSLAEDWSVTEDGLSYEFVLRKGAIFHHGGPVTRTTLSSLSKDTEALITRGSRSGSRKWKFEILGESASNSRSHGPISQRST